MPVLLRPDGFVQIGWDPRRAVLVRTPSGLTTERLASLMRSIQSRISMDDLLDRAVEMGLADKDQLVEVVHRLADANLVTRQARKSRGRSMRIRVHGDGPLSDVVVGALRCSGARVRHTSQRGTTSADADLVVLTDYLQM
ncbi:MAG: hypothetical protein QOH57_2694, partial [Mycobacterium sp.]|nr:hypothetical protein [Mycobacterium sp.]